MFKKRLITTVLLTPLVLLLIFYANTLVIATVILLLGILCGFEWIALVPIKHRFPSLFFMIGILAVGGLMYVSFPYGLFLGLALWALITIAILSFPRSQKLWGYPPSVTAMGLIVLPLFMTTLFMLYRELQGRGLTVYLLCLVWASDIGAYLLGKLCGRHRLIPAVSPGKTWEGSLGGFVLALLIAFCAHFYYPEYTMTSWLLLAVGVIVAAMFGDLAISMLKRRVQLKDTGNLLPGHGGILDRLDSLLFAVPCFYFGVRFLLSGLFI